MGRVLESETFTMTSIVMIMFLKKEERNIETWQTLLIDAIKNDSQRLSKDTKRC